MTIIIPPACEGRLLRSYLKLTLGLSTAVLAKLKNREDGILVNGRRVTVRYVLHAGDMLTIADRDTPETATERVLPVELPLTVLYEDAYVIALAKPSDMPTHPSHGHLCDTLANALAYRYRINEEPFVFRPLGRLDRNTSGVVVVGKTRAAAGRLSRSLQKGEVVKRYLAILCGEMAEALPGDWSSCNGTAELPCRIVAPIYRPDAMGIRRAVGTDSQEGAAYAESRYQVLAVANGYTLVLCEPVTGRTHQLRVHFSHMGFPILGDDIYGAPSSLIARQALHAYSLAFPLPFCELTGASIADAYPHTTLTDDKRLCVHAPLPADMSAVLATQFGISLTPPLTL